MKDSKHKLHIVLKEEEDGLSLYAIEDGWLLSVVVETEYNTYLIFYTDDEVEYMVKDKEEDEHIERYLVTDWEGNVLDFY